MTDMLPPTNIPDLSSLGEMAEWMMINRGIRAAGASHKTAFTLQMNCIRLLDGAIFAYEQGRIMVQAFHDRDPSTFGLGYICHAGTSFESCVWNFERFLKHARALRSTKFAELALKGLIPSNLGFFVPTVETRITKLRHTLAHLEGDAQKGKFPHDAPIALMPSKSGLVVGSHLIAWGELSAWLTEAHSVTTVLAGFKPTPAADEP